MWGIIFGGIQHSPVNDCSGACWNFEVLALEDELTSFYSAILITQYLGAVSKITEWSLFISKPNQSVSVIRVYNLTKNTKEAEAEWFYDDLKDLLELTPKKEKRERERDVLFIIGDWNAKVESQQIPGVTGKFGLGVQNEAGLKKVLPRECTCHSKHPLPTAQATTLHMDITRWSIPKSDCLYSLQLKIEKLYSINKTRPRLPVAQIMNSLLPSSDLNWRKQGKPLGYSGMT